MPNPTMVTVPLASTVATASLVLAYVTGNKEIAVAVSANGALVIVLVTFVPKAKVMVWLALTAAGVALTAAEYALSP